MNVKSLFLEFFILLCLHVFHSNVSANDPPTTVTESIITNEPWLRKSVDNIKERNGSKTIFTGKNIPFNAKCEEAINTKLTYPTPEKRPEYSAVNVRRQAYLCKDPEKKKDNFYLLQIKYIEIPENNEKPSYVTKKVVLYDEKTKKEIKSDTDIPNSVIINENSVP